MTVSKRNLNKLIYILIIIVAIVAGWSLSKIFTGSKTSNQIDISFNLLNNNNSVLSDKDLKGKSKVIFFGFTNCPDVCPISTDLMSASINTIKAEGFRLDDIEFLFITTDPKRDTPDKLTSYLSEYNSKIIGLTGNHSDLKKVWKNFFVHVLPVNAIITDRSIDHNDHEEAINENYMVEHTAFYYLFDSDDQLSAILPFGTSEEVLLTEIKKIL